MNRKNEQEKLPEGIYYNLNEEDNNYILNYALQQNGEKLIKSLDIFNNTKHDLEDAELAISFDPDYAFPFKARLSLPAGKEIRIIPQIIFKTSYLQSLLEKQLGTFTLQVRKDGRVLMEHTEQVALLAFDEWAGSSYSNETLAAFVTPNHPLVSAVISEASKVLREWGVNPSFEGYQSGSRNRIKDLMAAIYVALRRFNIVYCNPPASFACVQRVRLPYKVLQERKGTCLDLSVLYAACLESVGLHPLIVMVEGHAFAGCWLENEGVFNGGVMDNYNTMIRCIAHQDHQILLVNAVNFCMDSDSDFAEANNEARSYLTNPQEFECALDIEALRSRIKPISFGAKSSVEDEKFIIPQAEKITESAPAMDVTKIEVKEPEDKKAYAKQRYWEKKLLDLSVANPLISMYRTRTVSYKDEKGKIVKGVQRYSAALPLAFGDIGLLEDRLADGIGFTLRSDFEHYTEIPFQDIEMNVAFQNELAKTGLTEKDGDVFYDAINKIGNYVLNQFVDKSFQREQLFLRASDEDAKKKLKNIARTAKRSLEENGANTLYLVLGELRWFLAEPQEKKFKNDEELHAYIIDYIDKEALYAPLILVPVDIVRNVQDDTYVLRSRLEETQINITLLEFLKQNFSLEIDGLDPLPLDAHGVDMDLIMKKIRLAIQDKPFWEIDNDISLGHFSFAKFVMWNDIHNHAAEMAQNKVIDSLLHGYRTWKATSSNINEENIEAATSKFNMIMPTSADSSQMVSIAQALNGESFVLQGPPGTGKSQTITNLIANALYNGKKVLFVAEKKAALDVVKRRLDDMGLARFCLSMHSDDANKVSLLARLEQTLETAAAKAKDEKYHELVAELKDLREKLNGIIEALHCPRRYGCSLYQAIAILKQNASYKDLIKFSRERIIYADKSDLDQWKALVREYKAAILEMGGSYNASLSDYRGTSYSFSLKESFARAVEELARKLEHMSAAWNTVCGFTGLDAAEASYKDIEPCLKIFQTLHFPRYMLAGIGDVQDSAKLVQDIDLFLQQLASYKKELAGCEQYFDPGVLDLDVQAAKVSWEFAAKMGDFEGVQNRLHTELQSYAKPGVIIQPEMMVFNYNYLHGIIVKRDALLKFGASLRHCLGELYAGAATDAERVKASVQENLLFAEEYAKLGSVVSIPLEKLFAASRNDEFAAALQEIAAWHDALAEFACTYEVEIANKEALRNWPQQLGRMLENLGRNVKNLRSQSAYNAVAIKLDNAGMHCVVRAFEEGTISAETLDAAFAGGLYYNLVMGTVAHDERLADFYGMKYNQIIERYRMIISQYQKSCSDELVAKLCQRIASILEEPRHAESIALLKKAIKGKGRNKPIRKLFSEIQDLLPDIAPCMLMNPISVAQYIDISFPKFDLVIFDEASQIPTSEAVGAIARGIDTIVVGDSKQMPPTNFFTSSVTSEEDEDAEDMESLLVDCQTISLPVTELKWHYRSQHESLIAFSNLKYYSGHLLTFPTPNDLVSEVRIVHPDGFYDRKSGCNKAEAEAIVAEIIRRYRDEKLRKDSIGVITFNIKQQTYIEDMLEKTIKLPENEDLVEYNIPKNVFIKNLENVQGDEADVILFSIGYAPDKDGKLTMNFGPLNRDGGWRRLNVAVSRSRKSMIIYSVLKPEQIRNDVTAQGVKNLKEFLAYAENRKTLTGEKQRAALDKADFLVEKIAQSIESMGYKAKCNIGNSDFKIDIGVVNPYNEEIYLLGILLDSENCKEAGTAKDRFVLQPSILGGLGWKLVRLWILDWLDDAEKVKNLLRGVIEAELAKAKAAYAAEQEELKEAEERAAKAGQAQVIKVAALEPEEEAQDEEPASVKKAAPVVETSQQGNSEDNPAAAVEAAQVGAQVAEDEKTKAEPESSAEVVAEQEPAENTQAASNTEQESAGNTQAASENEQEPSEIPQAASENGEQAATVPKKRISRRGPKEYKLANLKPQGQPNDFYDEASKEKILAAISKVLAKEAPIEANLLRSRIVALWGFSKVSAKLDAAFRILLAEVTDNITSEQDRYFVWQKEQDPESYNIYREAGERALGEIAVQEIINAAYIALKENGSMPREELLRDVARRFSCTKFTKSVESMLDNAVAKALQDDIFRILANGKVGISRR